MAEPKAFIEIAYLWVNTILPILLTILTGGTLAYLIKQNNLNTSSIELSEFQHLENLFMNVKNEYSKFSIIDKDGKHIFGKDAYNSFLKSSENESINIFSSYFELLIKLFNIVDKLEYNNNKTKNDSLKKELINLKAQISLFNIKNIDPLFNEMNNIAIDKIKGTNVETFVDLINKSKESLNRVLK